MIKNQNNTSAYDYEMNLNGMELSLISDSVPRLLLYIKALPEFILVTHSPSCQVAAEISNFLLNFR